jgi:hypothetical protein
MIARKGAAEDVRMSMIASDTPLMRAATLAAAVEAL